MKQLHLFYLGGNAGRSNIEVHDVQFAACGHWQEAVPALKTAWFGDADNIHIDGWRVIDWADGYDITLSPQAPAAPQPRLYFVNVGAYQAGDLAERHAFGLFVAADAAEAKQKALSALLPNGIQQHKDNLKDVDNLLALDRIDGLHIRLSPNPHGSPAPIGFQGYQPI